MSKMGLSGVISFSLAVVSLTQISTSSAKDCKVLSARAASSSSVVVEWEKYAGATNYFLDLRVKNNTKIAPVVVTLPAFITKRVVNGLRPGTEYSVTLKVIQFFSVRCTDTNEALTVPDTSQIIAGRALSSKSIMIRWKKVPSADYYFLEVISQTTGLVFNQTFNNFSAVVENLQPSSNYDFYVSTANKAGRGRKSKVRTLTTLVEPPLDVLALQTGLGTAEVTWKPVDDVLLYRVVIRDVDDPSKPPSVYNISDTKLNVNGILPCSTYLISVSSFNKFLVPSESTDFSYTTNRLTPVSSVTIDYSCDTHSSMVQWTAVFGADSYKAMAISKNGTEIICTSPGTSCRISGLSCGQTYVVHVTPISESCTNTMNATSAILQTVPCPPEKLELLRHCSSEVIVFSWEHTNNTDHYMAKAVDSQGIIQECLTEDNSCYFTHTVCGRHYFFDVYSIAGSCKSELSYKVDIRTAPCIPQNLQTSADCSSDVLLSKWDLAEGALGYIVEAFGNRGTNSHYNCSSMSNSCAMEGLHCGEYLTVYITAYDDECTSPRTLGPVAETVPCAPRNVSAMRECGADSITVTWIGGSAIFYIAMARDEYGIIYSCNSIDLTCKIKGLKCGTNYTIYVIASNFMCNSTESETVIIETAACPPSQIEAVLDCLSNSALISWLGLPKINSYTATIEDEYQGLLSCSTANYSCSIPNMKCGQLYTVTVVYHDGICPSMPSKAIYIESVPCGPKLKADLDCLSEELTIGWNSSSKAEGFKTVVTIGDKDMPYVTPESELKIKALECGKDYTVKVMSYNGTCYSEPSILPIGKTPCVPTNVMANRNCGQTSVQVTWLESSGSLWYEAAAIDREGKQLHCSSNGTSCWVKGLLCSKVYRVGVVAVNHNCASNESLPWTLQTAPCPPSQFHASINCANNSAVLTWNSSPNAVSYTGKAVSEDGHLVTCDAGMNLSCHMYNLQCGKKYTFTVSASDGDCESPDSKPVMLTTAPCAVQNVMDTVNCSTNSLTITWTPGSMPANYSATAVPVEGTTLRCMSEGSGCVMSKLQCGQQYTVTVRAMSSMCDGHSSETKIVNSVPCVPEGVKGVVECSTNTLRASWNVTSGAASYITMLTGAGGFSSSCPSAEENCTYHNLKCAQMYTLSVMAVNDRCNSSKSTMFSAMTAPCDPSNVAAALDCSTGVATVNWWPSPGGHNYTVLAKSSGHMDSCETAGVSCKLTRLQCGGDYMVTVLAGDGKCNSSLVAQTNITTAPCAPVILNHTLDCVSNHAVVTWIKDDDAINVKVNATSSFGHQTSCNASTNNSCVLKLMCGHTYTVQAVAQGHTCSSEPSFPFQIVTSPCTPSNVEYTHSCDSGITFLSWDETLGRERFYAYVYSKDHSDFCNTSYTDCSMSSLRCGQMYNVDVIAMADHCNSSVPGVTKIQTAPCAPMNLSATLICENNTAMVNWSQSTGSIYYKVVANGRDGDVKSCVTNGTSCYLPNMHCAETYIIMVTPYSDSCKGYDSYPISYVAGPCPPTNVHVSLQCSGNIGHVTWDAPLLSDRFVARAVPFALGEINYNCSSRWSNCSLTDLLCGQTMNVTVVTIERGCMSEPSVPFVFQSVICPPSGLTGVPNCSNNDITVTWDPSPETGVNYFLRSQRDGGAATNFSTTQTSHVLTGLQCGQSYTLSVAATDDECTSNLSVPIQTETAPCPPTNLTVRAECGTNLGNLSWAPSNHAISYTVTVTGTHGHIVSCPSNTTTCAAKLDCGHHYSAVIVASSATCNSSKGETLSFNSAPCLPDNVIAVPSCAANSFAVQWSASDGDTGAYTALAIGSDESRSSCEALTTNCTVRNLTCGLNYSIVVTTSSVDCGIIEGSDYTMISAPCKPEGVMVNLQCSTNKALVTWSKTGPDQTQVVSVVSSRGMVTVYNSTGFNSSLDQLMCGETYTVSVVGHTDTCSSAAAFAKTQLKTAPCVPAHPSAHVDCLTGITSVTWDTSNGATSYVVFARGNLGHNDTCNNTDTNCNFLSLPCGQTYSITVVARHETCESLPSKTVNATTGPCPHSGLNTYVDCDTNTASVSWTQGSGILYYNASADAFDIVDKKYCSTNGSSCNVSSLQCGESYRVTVSGQGEYCPSPAMDWFRVKTAPCAPTQLMVDSSCESNNISVSWVGSKGSFSYLAFAKNEEGKKWFCNTTSRTSCHISNLPCGQKFEVYAVGVDDKCMGAKSNIKVIHTAPCVPHNIQKDLDCLFGVLNVTWQSKGHFVQFHTSVVSSNGEVRTFPTNKHHYVVPEMKCGLTYNVTVWAEDETCNSSNSTTMQVVTAPCPPSTFITNVDCATGVVSVDWKNSMSGVTYTVSAVDAAGRQCNCSGNSTNSGCNLRKLECGTKYNISITPSRNGCVGKDSPTRMITTVPCVPHLSNVEMDCLMNSAWVMYEDSAGAEDYVVMTTDSQGEMQTYDCNSTADRTCGLPPLMCSKNLTFTIKARDQQCSSAPSNAMTIETAPCPPENITNSVGCDNNTISIGWKHVPGAVSYKATLEQLNGGSHCCNSSGTGCDVTDLPCGEMYVLLVVAEGRTCNSSQSEGVIVRTVPCVPENLKPSLSCSNNVASMSWNYGKGGQYYTVWAVGDDGHKDNCSSYHNYCDLSGLRCGQYYTATVTAEDINCESKPSESVKIKTVPCTPEKIFSVMDCEANALVVSWLKNPGGDSHIATFQDSNGQDTTCQSMTGSCNMTGVGCGQIYHVSVVSSDGYCDSPPTPEIETPTAPCKVRNIEAEVDCYEQTALVSWYPSDGAWMYEVTAETALGHNVSCETNTTNCYLKELSCGESYSVYVTAVGQTCSSVAYMTGNLETEPCIPEKISTVYGLSIGQVLWDMAAGSEYYSVEAVTEQGLKVYCITNDTYCALYDMSCGQEYNVSVTANNHVCKDLSTSTEDVVIKTEPCPPSNVQTSVQCQTQMGTVSWELSSGAIYYVASLSGRDGHSLSCHSNGTYCKVVNLHCGVVYYTSVIAIGETLNSSSSATVVLTAAPCAAEDVDVYLDCYNNTAEVTWSWVLGAESYIASAKSLGGYMDSCETDGLWCHLTKLECDQTYVISITSIGEDCQTEELTNVTFSTRPCKPSRVGVNLECGTSTAVLHWEKKDEVERYMATANSSMGMTVPCNSPNSTCVFSGLQCGETYEFTVAAYRDMCSSEISSIVEIKTEPCKPTGLMVSGSCINETVELNWWDAEGAVEYEVSVMGDLGYVTSFRTEEASMEAKLPCGQLYTFTVKSRDERCESPESMPEEFKTGPCIPQHVESFTPCENNTGSVSWAKSYGTESYIAIAIGQDGHTHMCTSNTSICIFYDLHCGEVYTVHVVANDYLCSSLPSNSTTIHMAPCIPQNLDSYLNCSSKDGSLSWDPVDTAEYYLVTAEANSGHKLNFNTNDTWTYISEFYCGEEYFLSVQAADSECISLPSEPSKLKSVPCPPTDVYSSINCLSNIAVFSWTGFPGSEYHTATVTQEDGETMSCWSDGKDCGMPNLNCGQDYTVTVIASNKICDSDPTEGDVLHSVPCVPTDVDVEVDCATNNAVVSWVGSDRAVSFKVSAQSTNGLQDLLICENTTFSCTLTNLTCGQTYIVQVVAEDEYCSSLPSEAKEFISAPCTPTPGSVVLDCYTNSALLDWGYAEGAVNYTATALSSSGLVSICDANYTNCELLLECGETYDVTIVAINEVCSSPPSSSLQVESVPCPPENVETVLDCSSNTAWVGWMPAKGAVSYVAQAFGLEEHESGCEAESSESCIIQDLLCGFTYNISVIAVNGYCNVSRSEVTQLNSVPCVPQQVEARVVCESGAVAVSWEPSRKAINYTSYAQGSSGYASTCNSNYTTTCLIDDLLCGSNYSITVVASDGTCNSAESFAYELSTVACIPQNVAAEMICSTETGVVLWEEEEGVISHTVRAFGPDGHRMECNNDSICWLPNMHCGQLYNLTVTAEDGVCDNSIAYLNLQSVPCKPTNVKADLLCHSNSVAVTWERASGAVSYFSVGVTADGSHQAKCNHTLTYCDLTDLQCGQTYNVTVFSVDEYCQSLESDVAYVRTAPCPPQNVVVNAQCAESSMTISWMPNPDAEHFYVVAVSNTGARMMYKATGTSYSIDGLPCGQTYNVTVMSVRGDCESEPSAVVETSSAPCVPTKPEGRLDCVSNAAFVKWNPSDGAQSYYVQAQGVGGHTSNCSTTFPTSTSCKVPDLNCGTLYTFYVTAINKHCNSSNSTTFELETGPCALTSINATTQCNNNSILVEWELTDDTPVYVVTAEGQDQSMISCNSSFNWCVLKKAQCGMHYSIIVSTSSDKCSSLRSPPKKIKTAPCAPENVTVLPSCEDNGATVTWGHSSVATCHIATATGMDGHVASCNSNTTNNCTLGRLNCGQTYTLNVTAKGDNCSSPPSISTFKSVPCEPSGLSVDMNCETNSATLVWQPTEGAVEYFCCATPLDGDALCSDSILPICLIEGLECGEMYNFSVEASNGDCNSSFSAPLEEGAAPCPPTALSVRMQRIEQNHWAMMSWDKVDCPDVEYLVEITGRIDDNPQTLMEVSSYWDSRPYFEFPMPCSTAYNFTVRSRNSAGVSDPSSAFAGVTVPCAPQNVRFSGTTQSALLTWDASVFATDYTVFDVSGVDHVELCNTTEVSCQVMNFDPQNSLVVASNDEGDSIAPTVITGPVNLRRRRDLRTAEAFAHFDNDLRVPDAPIVTVSGVSLHVKWRPVKDANEYTLVIQEEHSNQPPIVRTVEGDFYTETDLKPWTNYSVRLSAKNTISQSPYSRPVITTTGHVKYLQSKEI